MYCINRYRPFYESLSGPEALRDLVLFSGALGSKHIPDYAIDGYTLQIQIFRSALTAANGELTLPSDSEPTLGLHSIAITGYDDTVRVFFLRIAGERVGAERAAALCPWTIFVGTSMKLGPFVECNGVRSVRRGNYSKASPCETQSRFVACAKSDDEGASSLPRYGRLARRLLRIGFSRAAGARGDSRNSERLRAPSRVHLPVPSAGFGAKG